jgi:sugar phosphate isomerase/epimerase
MHLSRRRFVRGTLGICAALGLDGSFRAAGAAPGDSLGKPPAGKIGDFKISLAEWSLHKALFKKEIDNLDFPRIAHEQYGIDGVEFVNQFFKDKAKDSAYLRELKARASDSGVTCVLIMIDGEGDMSATDKAERMKAAENHMKWVDAAAALGCHSIRINTGSNYSFENVFGVSESCNALVEYGEKHGINIICENHGGPSSNPDALLSLISWVGKDRFGTLPDFGNFERDKRGRYTIDIYRAIDRMMPFAKGVSAKSYDFDAEGRETKLDYARILKIVTDSGYHGYVGIEYEGTRLSEPDGIRATKRLLESLRGSMYTLSA